MCTQLTRMVGCSAATVIATMALSHCSCRRRRQHLAERSRPEQRADAEQEGPGRQLAGNRHVPAREWPSATQVSRQFSRRRNHGLRAIRAPSPRSRRRYSALDMASGRI